MGGFHYFTYSDGIETSYKPEHTVPWTDVIYLLQVGRFSLPSVREIQDKSKSNHFAKVFILLQALWFMTQCIARRIEHLPITELEIVTLAYTAVTFCIFLAWWDKPNNVEYPIPVFQKPWRIASEDDGDIPWWERVLLVIGGKDGWVSLQGKGYHGGAQSMLADAIGLTVGVVFGAVHCFATPIQTRLWRVSALAITTVPGLVITTIVLGVLSVKRPIVKVVLSIFIPLLGLLYITARLITVVLALINLSSLPPAAFETVHWTTLIPHL